MKIAIAEYDPQWVNEFEREQDCIARALNSPLVTIDHVGSTSVPGLGAKPVIDILIGVKNEAELDATINPMQQAGYTYYKKYEPLMPYRRYFVRLNALTNAEIPQIVDINDGFVADGHFKSITHIHTMVRDTYHWQRHIAFRDYLRAHNDIRDKYYQLKKDISTREYKNGLEYNDAKNEYVKEVERRAMAWAGYKMEL